MRLVPRARLLVRIASAQSPTAPCAIPNQTSLSFTRTSALRSALQDLPMSVASAWNASHLVVSAMERLISVLSAMVRMRLCTCSTSRAGLSAPQALPLTKRTQSVWRALRPAAPSANLKPSTAVYNASQASSFSNAVAFPSAPKDTS